MKINRTACILLVLSVVTCVAALPSYAQISAEVEGDQYIDGNLSVGGTITAGSTNQVLTDSSGYLDGTKLVSGSVGASKLGTGAVTSSSIAASAVGASALAGGAVTSTKLATGAVGSTALADGSVTSSKIAVNAVGGSALASGSVTVDKLGSSSVNSSKIADGSIAAADLMNGSVLPSKLNSTQLYSVSQLGINTSTVPHGGIGFAKLAIDGQNESRTDGPCIQLTTYEDDYPILTLGGDKHNSIGIKFDTYYGENLGFGGQYSCYAGSNAAIMKWQNGLLFSYNSGINPGDQFYFQTAMRIDCTNGSVQIPGVYDDTVTYPYRDLYIDSMGKIGYVSSTIKAKTNVRNATNTDTGFIYKLRPVMYDYKDAKLGLNQCGLIAEEVDKVCPRIVSYKRNLKHVAPDDDSDGNAPAKMEVTITNEPATVNYSQLIVPMLAEMQKLKARVDELEAKLAAQGNSEN